MQHLMAATFSAAGGKSGSAYKTFLIPPDKADPKTGRNLPTTEQVSQVFPVDPSIALISEEDIARRAAEIRAERQVRRNE